MVLVLAKLLTRILQCFQPANFLFASRENSKEFSKVQEVDTQRKLHKRISDIGGSIHLAAHDQLYPFSGHQNINQNHLHQPQQDKVGNINTMGSDITESTIRV